jgi:hypothetical protein
MQIKPYHEQTSYAYDIESELQGGETLASDSRHADDYVGTKSSRFNAF